MLSDWLVIVGVCLELLLVANTTTTTMSPITNATPTAIAQPLPPLCPFVGGWFAGG
ncbi:MAG: hypothetical protein WAN93_05425 [Solirubrobacteraceae bacterium]